MHNQDPRQAMIPMTDRSSTSSHGGYYQSSASHRASSAEFMATGVPVGGFANHMIAKNNLLLNVATPLLTLITQIKHTADHRNVKKLRAQIIEEVKGFEKKLAQAGYPMRTIVSARYCLCTAIDEAVLSQTWGTASIWVEQSLLSIFHKETWGGERFYIILENMAKDPRSNIDFLEFAYALLSLGFEGKYFGKHVALREEIRNRIFYRIRYSREKPDKTLSRHWQNDKPITDQQHKHSTIKRVAMIAGVVIIAIAGYYNLQVYRAASPIVNKLNAIATVSPITTFSEVISRPIVNRGMS